MAKIVLIDSGAIVAALRRRDQHHPWACSTFEALTAPCLTCEAVLSESFFLLERAREGKDRLCSLLERGIVVAEFEFARHQAEVLRLLRRYDDTPMSFADACLVRMAELHENAPVFTTDTDFRTYRKNGRQAIPLVTPW
jgi:predicted nucleic acid-binding protein